MPFKSQSQKGWMYSNLPKLAKKWRKETPKGMSLPQKVKPKEK